MLSQFPDISSWRQYKLTIEPHEVYTLNFMDTIPNIFVVNNPNQATLKIGISSIPRTDNYEFKVEYNTTETLGRPIGSNNLYILNDSSIPVKINVFSIEKDFDPAILKNMNVALDGYTIESSSEISGVKEGLTLPVGDVDVLAKLTTLLGHYPDIVDKLDKLVKKEIVLNGDGMTFNGVATDMTATNEILTLIKSALDNQNVAETDTLLAEIKSSLENKDVSQTNTLLTDMKSTLVVTKSTLDVLRSMLNEVIALHEINLSLKSEKNSDPVYKNNVGSFGFTATNDCILHFDWLFNDGGVSKILINDTIVFTMLEGESFSEMRFKLKDGDVLEISKLLDKAGLYRIKYWVVEGV